MRPMIKRAAVALSAAVAAVTVPIVTAAPAHAAEYCPGSTPDQWSLNTRHIALPGKPDINLSVSLCFHNEVGFYQTVENIEWASTTGGDGWGTKFNYIYGVVWTQKSDANKCSTTGHPNINAYSSGSYIFSCSWKSADTSGMSGDGKIVYDVANDGKGEYTWQLTGTS